ncbi:MAG TPA: lysophospholipid acyltransferase family protein [Candidatus Saccharimonadales bacterium]|nr:lysophospholipid acyltransferase family protein [Candidatus Saccharimonadales bacterium]
MLSPRIIVQCAVQIVIVLFSKILLQPFTRRDYSLVDKNAIKNIPHLLIGNHRRGSDPFALCSILPWASILKILPIGFMTHNVFYDSPLRPLLWLAGCYPAKSPKGQHKLFGIEGSLKLIKEGYSICIFPEGTRIRKPGRGEAHWGVIKIHAASQNTPFILAHIEYKPGIKAWFTFNRRIIRYKLIENPQFDNPELIMDEIFSL